MRPRVWRLPTLSGDGTSDAPCLSPLLSGVHLLCDRLSIVSVKILLCSIQKRIVGVYPEGARTADDLGQILIENVGAKKRGRRELIAMKDQGLMHIDASGHYNKFDKMGFLPGGDIVCLVWL